jgi:hypothetical protein
VLRLLGRIAAAASLLALVPAEAQQSGRQAKQIASGGFSMETGEACAGLSPEECCSQMLELAGFRAQGDYLPRLIKTTVHLVCQDERKVVAPQVCRSIATSRGFAPKEVDAICKPAVRECKKDGTCRQCLADLGKLSYQGSAHACYALTYMPDRSRTKIVVLNTGQRDRGDPDTRFELKRRHVVR